MRFKTTPCALRILWLALGIATVGLVPASHAGPPLISDDPNTIGPGRAELIIAADVFDQGSLTTIAPTLDLTVGLVDRLDATLVVTQGFDIDTRNPTRSSQFVEAGIKWQSLNTRGFGASFSPAVGTSITEETRAKIAFPLQLGYTGFEALGFGVDAAIIVVPDSGDTWRAGGYATLQTSPTLTFLTEVWSQGMPSAGEAIAGVGGGFDWETPLYVHILAAAGTGIASRNSQRVDWYSYLGLQWAFHAWQ